MPASLPIAAAPANPKRSPGSAQRSKARSGAMRNRQLQPASQPLEITSLIYVSTNCLPTCSHQIPRNSLNWTEGEEGERLKEAALNGMTLNNCTSIFAKHRIYSLKIKDNGMTFSDNGCDYAVQELARGDWDGDGDEDALILVSTYYLGGSGRFYEVYVVSKNQKLRQLKLSVQDAVLPSTTDSAIDKK